MDNVEFNSYKDVICSCPLLKGMSESDIAALPMIISGEVMTCPGGAVLDSAFLYIVLKGSIRIEKQSSDGRYIPLKIAQTGAAVNAASVLSSHRELSRLTSVGQSIFLKVNEQSLRCSLKEGGVFSINYTEFLTDRICFLNDKIASFTGYSAESRLTLYLQEHRSGDTVELPPLKSLADFLGVGRASLYRALDSMESEGTIKRDGHLIYVTGNL